MSMLSQELTNFLERESKHQRLCESCTLCCTDTYENPAVMYENRTRVYINK